LVLWGECGYFSRTGRGYNHCFRQSCVTPGIGLLTGLGFSFSLTYFLGKLIGGLLYGVRATSPVALIAMSFVLAMVGIVASYVPARRAAKVDPMVALHYE